jgi:hypothetical protein
MLQTLLDNNVNTFIAEILPCIDDVVWLRHPSLPQSPNLVIDEYNAALHRAAAATDPAIPVIPTHLLFESHVHTGSDSWILPDGIHPSPEGARQLAIAYADHFVIPSQVEKRLVLFGDSIHAGEHLDEEDRPAEIMRELFNPPPPNAACDWILYQ